ncbi:flavin monoamine oxidase family protein [Mesorhizobium dulcispinae]|uniref:flavin monoamine oxidase family protein n=1 Tax=Mesorhizobium dulcispinae TaxID=3072316 RepID=UPI002A24B4ED|nr:FAD-dependent oxidoreductase [Mesorhizobium sp. VK23D]MDX8521533.1 FAD-dependent oxidoreductase [Mesorhizobium sp. VK23D]
MAQAVSCGKEPLDIAVVGAGMAGLFLAWRLLSETRPAKVAVFETTSRVGGRASTVSFPGEPDFSIDLGAMTLMPQHRLLRNLSAAVGVTVSDPIIATGANRLHLRGKSLSYSQISRFAPRRLFPYQVSRRLQAKGPSRLLRKAAAKIVPGSETFGSDEWNRAAGYIYRGRKLIDWSAWEALSTVLRPDELAFAEDAVGYSLLLRGPNAAETFRLALGELSGGLSYLAPDGGFQPIAERIAEQIVSLGGAIRTNHTAISARRSAQGLVLSVAGDGETFEVQARKVVLALPALPLRILVENTQSFLGRSVAEKIGRAQPWPMLTLAACYPAAWWERQGIKGGHSVTDLPARQIWHFARPTAVDGSVRRGAVVAYCDGPHIDYWRKLLPQLDPHTGFAPLPEGHPALEAFHEQMFEVCRPSGAQPEPTGGFAQDWGASAYGGASHVWSRGTDIATVAPGIRTLAPDLHICGEAWSNSHGWIEGALESAEDLLQQEFGLKAWLA